MKRRPRAHLLKQALHHEQSCQIRINGTLPAMPMVHAHYAQVSHLPHKRICSTSMSPPKLFRSKHRIAVIGLYSSGKTVFITSFVNHILHHSPEACKLGEGGVRIIFDEELPPSNGIDRFPYEEFRCDNNGKWPGKTRAIYQYRCSFYRDDWKWTKGELTLIDIPGERLADIPMSKLSYAQWSDWLLDRVFQDQYYRGLTTEFISTVKRDDITEHEATLAYRRLLAELYKSYRPVITPSTFLLQTDGTFHGASIISGDMSKSVSGLEEDEQFTPLPPNIRLKNKALSEQFSKRYRTYRRRIASPLAITLSRCNALVVLVDVTTLLAANTGMFNGNRALLEQLFKIISPGKGLFGVGLTLLSSSVGGHWRQSGISKIAFVATKADKVHKGNRLNLKTLVADMSEGLIQRYVQKSLKLDYECFACAAVKSTNSQPNGLLRAKLPGNIDYAEYQPSEVPEKWPDRWHEGEFVFPDVAPRFPDNTNVAPGHLGMNKVIEFLL